MTVTVKHAKTNNITAWTQAQLDVQIAWGNFPVGTLLADITLSTDWNSNHTITGLATVASTGAYSDLSGTPTALPPSGSAGGDLTGTYPNPTVATGLNAAKIADGSVSNTEFQYLDGVTSSIQTQIGAKFTLPAFTSGSVPFSNGTTLLQDNSNFFYDTTNHRLGLGTTTPMYPLTNLNSTGLGSHPFPSIIVTGSLTPNLTGTYVFGGMFNSHPYYVGPNGYIWWGSNPNWFISPSLGVQSNDFFNSTGATPPLNSSWGAQLGASGTPTTTGTPTGALTVDASGNLTTYGFVSAFTSAYLAGANVSQFTGGGGTGAWIDMPITGPSGLGSSGAGNNAWIAYVYSNGQWLSGAVAGDIVYRNTSGKLLFGNGVGATTGMAITSSGVGFAGVLSPTAQAHHAAGTATAGTGPLKFTSGTNLTTAEAGAVEYDGTQLYFSPSTVRHALIQDNGSRLTSGRVPFAGTSGYLQDDADMTFATDTLTTTKIVGSTSISSPLVNSTGTVRLKGYTVATLPTGSQGDTAFVTDALAPAFLAIIVGGGAAVTPVFHNGTNWVGY